MRLIDCKADKLLIYFNEKEADVWKDSYPKDSIKRVYGAKIQMRKLQKDGADYGMEILIHDVPNFDSG